MSCYLRHLDEVLEKADLEVNTANRKKIDEVMHKVAGVQFKSCGSTWRELKRMMAEDEEALVQRIHEEFAKA